MARVLLAWEGGGRLSHLSNLAAIARILTGEGHLVAAALRELQNVHRFFSGVRLQYYQAPFKQGPPPRGLERYLSYAHVLYASGHAVAGELVVLLSAWVGILQAFRPDLLIVDHGPTALLASRAFDLKRIVAGSGFAIPPVESPLGVLPDVPRTGFRVGVGPPVDPEPGNWTVTILF